ncbi:transient receptor potential ca2 channel (trp-cc) family protein [Plasmopara halstedii]|uniref:Transient receptor potential ca2 channel (Trp-cc) family protein n=1 Tax=Plasmopara halstedii TaxID=4781 RepID=A0A0P1B041_PLAHL|nr:transient receptor potential ca2 channel (trp-cc) family protein [Plasmopara halstedii]CEG47002.1 transient receptor potential ca2 channel (trp-cc) family protein [Plasmopara halstedii]|eukprot:XP_024583371.1 transient receptor potential ca2 channel (trp-cc) family protein [Plasmopara halstedii]
MESNATLTVCTDDHVELEESLDPPTQYVLLETPMKEYLRQDTFDSDAETRIAEPIIPLKPIITSDSSEIPITRTIPIEFQAITLEDAERIEREHEQIEKEDEQEENPEHTIQLTSLNVRDSVIPQLPKRYLNTQFQSNSYFSKRLLRLSQFIVLGDIIALGFFYFYESNADDIQHGKLYVGSPLHVLVHSSEQSCSTSLALAALVYHLFPAVLILGLPASGLRIFEPFRREHRFDQVGRLQKVKRTVCLQVCELVGVTIFLYEALILGFTVYYVASGKIFVGCNSNIPAYIFCGFAFIMFWLLFVLMRAFARFREHLKMQLGAFKESDQTGDVKAHMLRSKMKRRKRQQRINGHSDEAMIPSIAGSTLIKDIKKRLFRGAHLGDLKLLRRSIRIAKAHLGDTFAEDLYPDPVMMFGIFGFARKNPMHVAAYQGNIAAMELLYKAHFRINVFDKVSRWRLSTGDVFWYLASYFIPKTVVSADETYNSVLKTTLVTPLHCAVSTGRLAAVQWLIAHGADVNLCSKSSSRCESRLPPIFLADHPEIVHVLLRNGANHLAIPDPGHMNTITVLQLAYLRGNYAVAQVLEDWGGDVALTPLHAAAAMNDVATIRSLLRKKVNPDVLGELGYVGLNKRTPLHWAAVNGAVGALEILLAAEANANFQDAQGRTALHWAARVNRVDSVKVLLAHGADPTIVDDCDMTPIMCAACAGGTSVDMFKVLVASGGDINHQLRVSGDTALHLAVKLDDQQTALALLSLGGDIMRTNHDGFRPIDCTTSTRLQFEIKRAAGTRDVMISYTHSHMEFALKLRKSLEDANITVWLDLMDPSGIGGGSVWREEIARGITNAAVVLCILTEDYTQSEWCLKELALAKQVGTPILAISTEHAKISEELQVYLYTRQLVPFESAIVNVEHVNGKEVRYEYDEFAYKRQLRMLLDGMRDEIEKRKEDNIKRNMRRAEINPVTGLSYGASGIRNRQIKHAVSGMSSSNTYGLDSMKFDERMLVMSAIDPTNHSSSDSNSSFIHDQMEGSTMQCMLQKRRHRGLQGSSQSIGSNALSAVRGYHDPNGSNLSVLSSASSSNSFVDDCGVSDSIMLDTGGYYFYRTINKDVSKRGGCTNTIPDKSSNLVDESTSNDSIVESLEDLNKASASGEQFVFISHGNYHQRFVQKLCVEMCRDGGLRCYVDRKHMAKFSSTIDEDKEEDLDKTKSKCSMNEDMSVRIHEAKEAILKCSAFVLLISEKTLASELVKDQLAFAEDKGKKILPVVVNRTNFSLDVKYSLARSEFFHFFTKGDMMGFRQSLRHLLNALREEVYGISIGAPLRNFNHLRSFNSAGNKAHINQSNGSDVQLRGGFADLRDSSLSTRLSFHPSFQIEGSLRRRRVTSRSIYASSRSDPSNFGLPPTRLSQTFTITSGPTRSITSESSLSQSMIGNFSMLARQLTDDFDEEDENLSYAGIQDEDFNSDEEIEMGKDGMIHVVHEDLPSVLKSTQHTIKGAPSCDGHYDTRQRGSNSSISMMELTESSDSININYDAMLGDKICGEYNNRV